MLKWAMIGLGLCFVLLICVGYVKRANWIEDKIATLSAPASLVHAADNAKLPPKGAKPRIVLIGDSRIAQWPTAAMAGQWEIINRGIGGETVAQLVQRFDADAIALDPDVIVIEAGVNDLVAATFMDDAEKQRVARSVSEGLRQMASKAATARRRVIVATIIPPAKPDFFRRPVWNERLRDLVAGVNADLKNARLPDGASLIDLLPVLQAEDQTKVPDEYRLDTLHLNEAGYRRLTEALASHLQLVLNANPLLNADRPKRQ
jgi:lysophospholipase L1-like esterase